MDETLIIKIGLDASEMVKEIQHITEEIKDLSETPVRVKVYK